MNQTEKKVVTGVVTEALPDTLFKVKLEGDVEQLCFLAGKMRLNRIKVIIGDRVTVEIDPYGGKGRIVRRGWQKNERRQVEKQEHSKTIESFLIRKLGSEWLK